MILVSFIGNEERQVGGETLSPPGLSRQGSAVMAAVMSLVGTVIAALLVGLIVKRKRGKVRFGFCSSPSLFWYINR